MGLCLHASALGVTLQPQALTLLLRLLLLLLLQGWGSDGGGGDDDGLGDDSLDAQMVRDLHFGGGLFEKSKRPQHEDGGEDGEGGQQRKSKKEVRSAVWRSGGTAPPVPDV